MLVTHELYIGDLPRECIDDCSAQGAVDEAVSYWVDKLDFQVDPDAARRCLRGCGAWDDDELADDEQNRHRILWLACGAFAEWDGTENSPAGSDVFFLE